MATLEERVAALETQLAALTAPPTDYYTMAETGETVDAAVQAVKNGNFVVPSSTATAVNEDHTGIIEETGNERVLLHIYLDEKDAREEECS